MRKELALNYYLQDNYSVIPCGPDKKPTIGSWKKYQTEKADETQISYWWNEFPNANIGIVTGKISGITVVDIDCYKENHVTIDMFPETFTVRTGNGGYHLIYQYQEGLTISANAYAHLPGVDIRSDGGYIVGAGSITNYVKDGKQVGGEYTVIKDIPKAKFPIDLFTKNGATLQKPKKALAEVVGVSTGGRNDAMASLIGGLLASKPENMWLSECLPAVELVNQSYTPPLPLDELRTTFNSIANIERRRRAGESADIEDDEEQQIRLSFVKNKTQGTFDLARYMVKKFDIITIGEKEREMFVYRGGYYFQAENEIIYPEIQRVLGNHVTKSAKMETYHKIADMTANSRDIFTSAPLNFIPLVNGVYDRNTKELLPHDAKYRFTYQLPVKYDKDATCPRVDAFFDQVLDPEQKLIVEEWIGYYFWRNYMFKKAVIFVGEGDTGKTTLLQVIMNLIGDKNISGIPLQKMATDKFAAAQMFEKHANIVDELDPRDIAGTGNFKIATGGGTISGEYKFGNQFQFSNFAKLTFACNKIPDVKDFDDEAYFNRWIVIRFGKTIEKKIPDFHKTLTTEEERSGLFNVAMRALDRLIEQGKFSYGKNAYDTKLEMMRSGSSIAVFAADMLRHDPGAEISKEDMYSAYEKFCNENMLPTETIKMLGTRLNFYVPYISEGLMNVIKLGKPERVKAWRNVSLVDNGSSDSKGEDENW